MVLALFGICLSAVFLVGDLEFETYLKFACPPPFWWGACSLELVCFLLVRRLFGGVLVVWCLFVFCLSAVFLAGCLEFVILDTKLPRQSQTSLTWPIEDPAIRGRTKLFRSKYKDQP